jgi:hypothetical protein
MHAGWADVACRDVACRHVACRHGADIFPARIAAPRDFAARRPI